LKEIQPPNTLTFSIDDIRENSDPDFFHEGENAFNNHAVLSCKIVLAKSNMLRISSEVEEEEELFRQDITIKTLANGKKDIIGDCDCLEGFNCKHVVAALLYTIALQTKPTTPSRQRAIQWLKKFPAQKRVPQTQEYDETLLYVLFEKRGAKRVTLSFYKAKVLKKGGFGKKYPVESSYLLEDPTRYKFITKEDLEIIKMLNVFHTGLYPYNFHFEGELATIVLEKMIQTQRAFFNHNTLPLQKSTEALIPEFFWQEVKKGEKKISSNLRSSGVFIETKPFSFIDPATNMLYPLQTEYDAKTLRLLLDAPTLPKEEIDAFMREALKMVPDLTLPIPEEFSCEEIVTKAVPYLQLQTESTPTGDKHHYIRLSFFYDDYSTDAYPQKQFFLTKTSEGKELLVKRDLEAEQRVIEYLLAYGFEQTKQEALSLFFNPPTPDLQSSIERWRTFLEEEIPQKRSEGWKIEISDTFSLRFHHADEVILTNEASQTHEWFKLHFDINIEGKKISLLPLVASLLDQYDTPETLPPKLNLQLESGDFVHIDAEKIKPVIRTIFELYSPKERDAITVKPYNAHLLGDLEEENVVWKGERELLILGKKLRSFEGIENVTPAKILKAKLRNYQQFGLNWLTFLNSYGFSGILADDMGLGKTLQTLAFLQKEKELGNLNKPTLIVMPTSLIGNWKNEIEKFTPDLSYLALYGSERNKHFDKAGQYDILLTTYQLALRDHEILEKLSFYYLILDEAQKIKNPKAKMTQAIKSFHAEHKLALTGTPMENHLGELWSIFDFLMPGFLGSSAFFKQRYQNPIEKRGDKNTQTQLQRKIAPFMLRRTKEEVLDELPPKVEIVQKVTLGSKQALLYENIRIAMEKRISETIKAKGISGAHMTILDALLKLRQTCCDPRLLSLEEAQKVDESAKMETLFELLEELLAEGRKILLFSQFTTMLELIEEEVKKRQINYTKLTGKTRKREEAIEKFTQDACNLFLISLKAGGVGLNLTQADTVIHYDPWWNPAVENQATDRAHRIGQTKTVFVYKLVVENSIEEKILDLQENKKALYSGLYDQKEKSATPFNAETLLQLLQE